MYFIYYINCPITNVPIYVGMTGRSIEERLKAHMCEKCIYNIKKETYFKSLSKNKIKPTIHELDRCDNLRAATNLEVYWIHQFKSWGFSLLNKGRMADRKIILTFQKPLNKNTAPKMYIKNFKRYDD
jgi:hypothetical protein